MESANGPSSQRNSADFGVLGFPSFRAYVNASFGRPTFPRGGEKKGEIPLSTRLPREIIECLSRRGGIPFEFPFAGISFRRFTTRIVPCFGIEMILRFLD